MRAFRIGTYHDVTDHVNFERGKYTVSVYVDREDPIGYEVREYHDVIEVRAWAEALVDQSAVAERFVSIEMWRDARADALRLVIEQSRLDVLRFIEAAAAS